jgi:hypothetical protein
LIAADSPEGSLVSGVFMLVKLKDKRNIFHYIAKVLNDFCTTSGMTEASTTSLAEKIYRPPKYRHITKFHTPPLPLLPAGSSKCCILQLVLCTPSSGE